MMALLYCCCTIFYIPKLAASCHRWNTHTYVWGVIQLWYIEHQHTFIALLLLALPFLLNISLFTTLPSVICWVLSHKSYVFTICLYKVFICWILLHLPLVYHCSLCHLLFERYSWLQQCFGMLLHHRYSCPTSSTDRIQSLFLVILRNFGNQCFLCLLVYLYSTR